MNKMPCHISDMPPDPDAEPGAREVWEELPRIVAGFDTTPWHQPEKENDMNHNPQSVPMPDDMTLDQAVPSQSNYISKDDVGTGLLVQIAYMTNDQVEGDNAQTKQKAVLHFNGDVKPLILNQVNKELLKQVTGAQTLGQLKGQAIILYNDPTIMFQGRMTGGIRIRSAQQQAPIQPQAPQPGTGSQDFDDSIPY